MASPTIRLGLPGVQGGDDGPFPRSLEHTCYAGESPWGPKVTSFGGRDDSSGYRAAAVIGVGSPEVGPA
jgi:hypothetical protein